MIVGGYNYSSTTQIPPAQQTEDELNIQDTMAARRTADCTVNTIEPGPLASVLHLCLDMLSDFPVFGEYHRAGNLNARNNRTVL